MMLSKINHMAKNFYSFGFEWMCLNPMVTSNYTDEMANIAVAVEGSIYIDKIISNTLQRTRRRHLRVTTS